MKAIYAFTDEKGMKTHIVLGKIRKVSTQLGTVVVQYDNGDSESIDVLDGDQVLKDIINAIEEFYSVK